MDKGSSHFFVISAVLFDDNLEAEKTAVYKRIEAGWGGDDVNLNLINQKGW